MKRFGTICIFATTLVLLSGCGDSNAPKTPTPSNPAAVGDGTMPKIVYTATLGEGIDFKRDGYPAFVSAVVGLADEKEFFGRWSVADDIIFSFVKPLPTNFTLELEVAAFGPNVSEPIKIAAGATEQDFVIKSGHPEEMQKVTIHFATTENARSIKLKVPFATSPKALVGSPDERRLGIAFGRLRIFE